MSDLRELLEARREDAVQRAEDHARGLQSTHRIVPPAEEAALLDLALAAERRRQAQMRHSSTDGNAPQIPPTWRVVREAEYAEDAALDRLAAHLRGGAA